MKRSRFTDSQILAVLRQAEAGTAVPAPSALAWSCAITLPILFHHGMEPRPL
jgi:hypothetical protein